MVKVCTCPKCNRDMVAIYYLNEETRKISVDYLVCDNCGHTEAVSPMDINEWQLIKDRILSL